jgi:DNA repair protein SbcD/Mre11
MSSGTIRVLLIADTHLGFGDHHFASYERALQPAFRGDVDLVVHGGDVFFRSRVKPGLVMRAFEPLKRLADSGVPVVVVPGNHERSAIPCPLLAAHPRVHIFDRPRTLALTLRGVEVAVAGFPCERHRVQDRFAEVVEQTGWRSVPAAVRFLCFHQSVEGATVGPAGYVFGRGPDVIPGRAIPRGFAAVLAGHIHRHQVLTADLSGRPLAAPVFYPGSTERTSRAENGEAKGYVTIELEPDLHEGGHVRAWTFHQLSPPVPHSAAGATLCVGDGRDAGGTLSRPQPNSLRRDRT